MGRKSNGSNNSSAKSSNKLTSTGTSSSNAAPTFTSFSFASATAIALGQSLPSSSDTPDSEWDGEALRILNKLSKRDATTRSRSLVDLTTHLSTVPSPAPSSVGAPFLSAWPSAFRAIVFDADASVRLGAFSTMTAVISAFGKRSAALLKDLAPYWAAARGDSAPGVASAAKNSLDEALPRHKQKVLANVAADAICAFCKAQIEGIGEDDAPARRVAAVIFWTVYAAESISPLKKFLKGNAEGAFLLGKLARKFPGEACAAGTAVASALEKDTETTSDVEAEFVARQLAKMGVHGISNAKITAFELVVVLLRKKWHCMFDASELQRALVNATQIPMANITLVKDVLALMNRDSAADAAEQVLQSLRKMLSLDESEMKMAGTTQPPLHVVHHALPVYLDIASFVYTQGAATWFDQNENEREALRMSVVKEHLNTTLHAFLSATLLQRTTVRQRAAHVAVSAPASAAAARRRPETNNANTNLCIHALAEALCNIKDAPHVQYIASNVPAMLSDRLRGSSDENEDRDAVEKVVARYKLLLQRIAHSEVGRTLLLKVAENLTATTVAASSITAAQLRVLADTVAVTCECGLKWQFPPEITQRIPEIIFSYNRNGLLEHDREGFVHHAGLLLGSTLSACSDEQSHRIMQRALDMQPVSLAALLTARVLDAHAKRRLQGAERWIPVNEVLLKEIVGRAIETIDGDNNRKDDGDTKNDMEYTHALPLLAAVANPAGGASLSEDVSVRIANAVVNALRTQYPSDSAELYNQLLSEVIAKILSAPVPHVELREDVKVLVATAVAKGASSIRETALYFAKNVSLERRSEFANAVLQELCRDEDGEDNTARHSGVWLQFVQCVAKESIAVAVELHAELLQTAVSARKEKDVERQQRQVLAAAVVEGSVLMHLFGGVNDVPFEAERFIACHAVFSLLSASSSPFATTAAAAQSRLEAEIAQLSKYALSTLTQAACNRALVSSKSQPSLLGIIALCARACLVFGDDYVQTSTALGGIVEKVVQEQRSQPSDIPTLVTCVEMTEVFVRCTARKILPALRTALEKALLYVRRDGNSPSAIFALMLISATVIPLGHAGIPQWLSEIVRNALHAVRRQRQVTAMRGASGAEGGIGASTSISCVGAAAYVMKHAIQSLEEIVLPLDDWRFWTMHVQDALLDAQYSSSGNMSTLHEVSALAVLGAQLVEADLSGISPKDLRVSSDDIARRGAWTAVNLLPAVLNKQAQNSIALSLIPRTSVGMAFLATHAVSRGVLLHPGEDLPLPAEKVYALVPLLSCESPAVRDAVYSVLRECAMFDLHQRASQQFPESGFESLAEEERFVTKLIPEPLRSMIEPFAAGEDEDEDIYEDDLQQLGYFKAWELFLELLAPASTLLVSTTSTSSPSSASQPRDEERSFRRAGVAYLRAHPYLYPAFFQSAARVAVESFSAAHAASQLLSCSKGTADTKGRDSSDEMGVSAGRALARALQRLPALSRRIASDEIERSLASKLETFIKTRIAPGLIAEEVKVVREEKDAEIGESEGMVRARGSAKAREVTATYEYADVALEICLKLPECYPLQAAEVCTDAEAMQKRTGMSDARWRKTLLAMSTLLRKKDGCLAEAILLWKKNLDKTFQGTEECPICYSVLHISTAALPKMKCSTCRNVFHSECLCKWFKKSNSSTCPLCRSAFKKG